MRSAIVAVPSGATHTLLFGDQVGWFYALDAETGRQLWKKRPDPHESVRLTGAPATYQGTVYVPVSSWEENRPLDSGYACCTFRGSIVAYRISDGAQLWKTYTIPDKPHMIGKNKAGIEEWGTIRRQRMGILRLWTQNEAFSMPRPATIFSLPPTPMSDSVLALDLKSRRILWARQTTPGDIWTSGCGARGDCPGPDFDFGSSVLLEKLPNGHDILLASQKSGVVYGLDPERKGELLWQIRRQGRHQRRRATGMASDGQNVYAATSDLVRGGSNPDKTDPRPLPLDPSRRRADGDTHRDRRKGLVHPAHTMRTKTGLQSRSVRSCDRHPRRYVSGSLDGHVRAYTAEEGKVVWDFDTVRDFET